MDFENFVKLVETELSALGSVSVKDINYGRQLTVLRDKERASLNVYNGKKGIRTVWGGTMSLLREEAEKAVDAAMQRSLGENASRGEKSLSGCGMIFTGEEGFDGVWAGSDESGKGDYFGPLSVAAVCLDKNRAAELIAAGVRDCKALSDKKILELAELIEKRALCVKSIVLEPDIYNAGYESIKAEGGSLNDLLASLHVKALSFVLEKCPSCGWVLVDQFMNSNRILRSLTDIKAGLRAFQRPRAEEDIAVACASVVARAAFLRSMEALSERAGIGPLPKGGGPAATQAAARIARMQGIEALKHYVKLHFANTSQI